MISITLRPAVSVILGVGMAALFAGSQVHAESTSGEATVTSDSLQEVVVTARKREERLLEAPLVITLWSGETLDRYGITSMNDIAEMTPGLIVGNTSNNVGATIAMRGVGAATDSSAIDQAVSVNVDGVQVSQASFLRLGQFDLERVEVLKGPQSLFFGKNSTAGIISLTSRSPGTQFEGHVKAGHELSNKRSYVEGAVSGPIADRFAARLFLYGAEQDGWFRNTAANVVGVPGIGLRSRVNSANDESEWAGRLTLTYASAGGTIDSTLKIAYNHVSSDNGPGSMAQKFLCPLGYSQMSAEALMGGIAGDDDACKIDRYWVSTDPFPELVALDSNHRSTPQSDYKASLASLEINWALSDVLALTLVSGASKMEQFQFDMHTYSNASLLGSSSVYENRQFTQEVRLASDFEGRFNFMAGAFYQDADLEDDITVAAGLGNPVLASDVFYRQAMESRSVFGEVTVKLLDAVDWSIGARYTDETKDLDGLNYGMPFTIKKNSVDYSNTSLQSTLRYRPSDNAMLYLSYREGFVAGGYDFNPVPPALNENVDISYRESTVEGVEAGYKAMWLDGRLQFESAVFRYEYNKLQLAAHDAVTLSLSTLNAGKATVQGVEAALQFRPDIATDLVISAQATYTDATYDEFLASCWTGQSIIQGCNLQPDSSGAFASQDLKGREMVRAPKVTANFGVLYDMSLGERFALSIGANAMYSSKFETTVEDDPRARHDHYWLLNANISLRPYDGRWEATIIGRNLTEELIRPYSGAAPLTGAGTGTNDAVPSDLYGVVGSPREIAVQVRYNF